MKPSEILKDEHRVIEQVLDCLEKIMERAQSGEVLDVRSASEAVDFFRHFADRCHHGKEEAHYFPTLEAKGFPREGGPTGVMRIEHEEGRAHVRAMREAIENAEQGKEAALRDFARHGEAFVRLLREHIEKENHCLFPMGDQALSDADQRKLLDLFAKAEHEEMGEGAHEKYLGIAHALADRLGVPRVKIAAGGAGCCGHHAAGGAGS